VLKIQFGGSQNSILLIRLTPSFVTFEHVKSYLCGSFGSSCLFPKIKNELNKNSNCSLHECEFFSFDCHQYLKNTCCLPEEECTISHRSFCSIRKTKGVTSQLTPVTKHVAVTASNPSAIRKIKERILTEGRYLYCKWE
jgi:hypothetical protein